MIERDRKQLVGAAGWIVAAGRAVHNVVEVTALCVPESGVEGVTGLIGMTGDPSRFVFPIRLVKPVFENAKRVVPERVDLDRFSAPRRDHPAVDLRVHPGELITFLPLHQEAVGMIHVNAEPGSAQVMPDNIEELRKQLREQMPILGVIEVPLQRVKKPKSGVGSVIESLRLPFRKHVGNEAIANVVREGSEDIARGNVPASCEGQTF